MFVSLEKVLRVAALLACAVVVGMIGIFAVYGVGQDPLQFVHSPAAYTALLLKDPAALRATIGLDNVFIVLYTTVFLSLSMLLLRRGAPRVFVFSSLGLLILLAFLDMFENFHFMVMLANAEQGGSPSTTEISAQVFESLLKFHVSYLGLFLQGFALSRTASTERLLSSLAWYVQLPVGVLIYITPANVAFGLVMVRFSYFVTALFLLVKAFGARDEVGSGARGLSLSTRPGVSD